ncbi:MAG: HalOD1 output domain-containing protein [Halolamina sp.]
MNKDNEDAVTDPPPTPPDKGAVRYRWDGETTPSIAVVEAVAATRGRRVENLPTLQQSVDPDALDALFTGDADSVLRLSFEYAGTSVTLYGDGRIDVLPP